MTLTSIGNWATPTITKQYAKALAVYEKGLTLAPTDTDFKEAPSACGHSPNDPQGVEDN